MRPPESNSEFTPDQEAPAAVNQQPTSTPPLSSADSMPSDSAPVTSEEPAITTDVEPATQPLPSEPVASAAAPIAPVAPVSSTPSMMSPTPKGSNKKRIMLAAVIAAALVLIGGATTFAIWYQNPDKVVTDALLNTLTTDRTIVAGNAKLDSKNVAVSVDVDLKSREKQGSAEVKLTLKPKDGTFDNQEVSINASSAIIENGDVYFKVTNIDKIVNTYIDSMFKQNEALYKAYGITDSQIEQQQAKVKQQYAGIVNKINDQWIKVSADDLKKENESSKKSTCITNELKKIGSDSKLRGEVSDLYGKNRFIVIKENLGTKDGSNGYLLDIDEDAAKKFGKGFETTEVGKAITKCDEDAFKDSSNSSSDSDNKLKDGRFELWVDQWSHKITKVVFSGKNEASDNTETTFSGDFKFDYATNVDDIKAPSNAKSITELQSEIEALVGAATQSVSANET